MRSKCISARARANETLAIGHRGLGAQTMRLCMLHRENTQLQPTATSYRLTMPSLTFSLHIFECAE
jgi:hypothetical protein